MCRTEPHTRCLTVQKELFLLDCNTLPSWVRTEQTNLCDKQESLGQTSLHCALLKLVYPLHLNWAVSIYFCLKREEKLLSLICGLGCQTTCERSPLELSPTISGIRVMLWPMLTNACWQQKRLPRF